ncbi:MAG: ABC transporter permease [Pseudonocardiaceae bacterium]
MRSLGQLLGPPPTWVGFLGRHLVGTVGVLIAASVASYALILLAPGDAARSLAVGRAGPGVTEEQVAAVRAQLSLDDPGYIQYARWLGDALTGDLGQSVRTGQSITGDLLERLPTTLFLALGAGTIALVVGVCTGAAGAVVRRAGWRSVLRLGALLGVSVPSFWLSYLLILVLAESLGPGRDDRIDSGRIEIGRGCVQSGVADHQVRLLTDDHLPGWFAVGGERRDLAEFILVRPQGCAALGGPRDDQVGGADGGQRGRRIGGDRQHPLGGLLDGHRALAARHSHRERA